MKRICRKIVPAVYLVIFTGLFIFHITLTYKIPNVAELRLNREKGEGITLGELDRSLPDGCSFYSEKDASVKGSSLDTRLVMLGSLADMESMPVELLTDGTVDTEKEWKGNLAVISRELALELFFTVHSAGQKMRIDGTEYIVAGIYENISPEFTRDGYERIYVPYESVTGWEEISADVIRIMEEAETEELRLTMGRTYDEYEMQNYAASGMELLSEYVPEENIFDLQSYWKILTEKMQLSNRGVLAGNGEISRMTDAARVTGILTICAGIGFAYFGLQKIPRILIDITMVL